MFLHRFTYMVSFVLFGVVQDTWPRFPGGDEERLYSGRTVRSASRPAWPGPARRPAMRRPAPTRPWYVWVLDSTGYLQSRTVFLDSVYIGFNMFVLPMSRPGRLSATFWRSKWEVFPWPKAPAPLCLAPTCSSHLAPNQLAWSRPREIRVLDLTN